MATDVQLLNAGEGDSQTQQLELVAEDFAEFVDTYGKWISTDGLFVQTDLVLEKGTEIDCRCRMVDGFELFAGRCLVAWVRLEPDLLKRPRGIGLHFLELDESSRQFVSKVAENHLLAGGQPFNPDRDRPGSPTARGPTPERLHSMLNEDRSGELEGLGSRKVGPVDRLSVGRQFAPGLEVEGKEPSVRSTHEFRAPVPRHVLDTLSGVPMADLQRDALRREGDRPPAAAAPKSPTPQQPERPPDSVREKARQPEAPPSWREPQRAAADSRAALDFVEAPRQGSKVLPPPSAPQRPISPEKASWDTGLGLGGPGSAAAPRAPGGDWRSAGQVPRRSAPLPPTAAADEQLRIDPNLLGGGDLKRGRWSWRWVLWAALLSLFALASWWALAGADQPWSLRSLLAEKMAGATGAGPSGSSISGTDALERGQLPARMLTAVEFEELEDRTVVTLVFDGQLDEARLSDLRIGAGSPRHVVKIVGIVRPPIPTEREAGTAHLRRVRFGLHRIAGDAELHAVLDLASPDVGVVGYSVLGERLVLRIAPRAAGAP